ncbi:hypothetical protein GCM10010831_04180 [Psychroflexus salis]|uniref:Uncharacterized protein n=1 Tax=Psychroflexus salis TaxID=1526574 RepID=A0A916ZNR9_9FLAO|nr:hypothetical protein GCM10010831_04180 [Psychroflexus salis]
MPIFFPINPDIIYLLLLLKIEKTGLTKSPAKIYCILNYTFISTSTPLGNSSFINASIVFEDEL